MYRTLISLAVVAALAGCAVTQPIPPKYDLPAPSATAAQNALLEHWWTAFDDPVLTALVEEALANNWDLRIALARIDAARSQVLLAQSLPAAWEERALFGRGACLLRLGDQRGAERDFASYLQRYPHGRFAAQIRAQAAK
jgi:hypothetical protein